MAVPIDGAPDRGQDPEPVIVEAGQFLDSSRFPLSQLGISFIQIGDDQEVGPNLVSHPFLPSLFCPETLLSFLQAARHLAALDDDLKVKYRIRDFVDCTPYQASDASRVASFSVHLLS